MTARVETLLIISGTRTGTLRQPGYCHKLALA